MLKIRLRRMGSRHRPFYRVVVSDSHRVPRASALEEVGYYDPRKTPATLSMNVERVDYWMSHGAQPSNTVKKLVARARAEGPVEAATEAEAAAETESTEAAAEATEAAAEATEAAAEATEAAAEATEAAAEATEAAAEATEAAAESAGDEAEASAEEAADGEVTDKTEESESA